MTDAREPLERRLYLGLAVLLAALWLLGLGARPLFNPDEGRYAEIPREMLAGGDWIIPHLNGLEYLEKPPLQYWATALSYRGFGVNEFAARLYGALCALGTIAWTFAMARRLGGVACAWRAAAMLGSMLMFCALGQLLTLDMSLTFYLTSSLAAFLFAQSPQAAAGTAPTATPRVGTPPVGTPPVGTAGHSRYWMWLAWVAAALGVMTKGIVAAAIPAAVLVLYSLRTRDFSAWRRLQVPVGGLLFLLIAVPWHWAAARRNGDFLDFYFVHEHLARYLTPVAQRVEPWWFFILVFVAGTAPWTWSAVRAVAVGWRRTVGQGFDAPLFLWIWVVFIVAFFSLSDSKLMPYILPAIPAVAVAAALAPLDLLKNEYRVTAILTLIIGVAAGAASSRWPQVLSSSDRAAFFLPLASTAAAAAVLLCVLGIGVLTFGLQDPTRAGVLLGAGWCVAWLWIAVGAAALAPVYSGVGLARAIVANGYDARAAPVYSVATYDQTIDFYLKRTVWLVQFRGELDFGLNANPGIEIPEIPEFERRWTADSQAFAVMEPSTFGRLRDDGVPMRVIARTAGRLVAARQ